MMKRSHRCYSNINILGADGNEPNMKKPRTKHNQELTCFKNVNENVDDNSKKESVDSKKSNAFNIEILANELLMVCFNGISLTVQDSVQI